MDDDAPALAGAIVYHAKTLCDQVDTLWRLLNQVSIPVAELTDTRNQNKATFSTESMARLYIYKTIHDLTQCELANRLANRPALLKGFGMTRPPTQQNISYAWGQFSEQTIDTLEAAAREILLEAHDHGSKVVELARRHGFGEFDSGRAGNRIYEDEQILDLFANTCLTQGSAHSEGEAGWFLDENDVCDDSTFLRVIKQFAMPSDQDLPKPLQEYSIEDVVAFTEEFQEALMDSFDAATENVLSTIRYEDPFDDRHVVAAIDFTHVPYHVWPWIDKERKIPKADYPPIVSGYKNDGEIKYGYTFATITIVGNDVPIILGIESVKERSAWEPEDAPADSKADVVDRLLETAQQHVNLDEVFLNRGFYSNEVYATIHDRGLVYMTPVPKYEGDYESIAKIKSKNGVDAAVKHDIPFAIDGELHHTAEFLYVPATDEEAAGNYAVFVTNRDHVALDEIMHVANSYSRRWDIENQYKSVKAFLPKTSSKDYRVRLFSFTFATLLYNLWRLTDYLVKVGMGRDIRSPPVVTARTFVRAVGRYLREGG
ncbi:transposase [Natrialba taiwanensis]|nr:transposase [Natrialba taiwanensis]